VRENAQASQTTSFSCNFSGGNDTLAARILLVEDDPVIARGVRAVLDQEGYELQEARSVPAALEKVESTQFDAVVVALPVGDAGGLAVVKRLKTRWPRACTVVLIADSSLRTAVEAVRAGADDFVLVPADPAELKATVAKALQSSSQLDDLTLLNTHLRRVAEERDELRRVAEERADRLQELDRLKEEFIATASHDLKAPLTSIKGYVQLLLRRIEKPEADMAGIRQGLDVIETQTSALAQQLDDLLDASRIQAGALDVRTAPCELAECLRTVLARLGEDERARVEVTLPEDMPLAGAWEQRRVEQVLSNLIRNGLKYSPTTESVAIAARQASGMVEVAVSDSGMGIPAKELSRLFDRFYRTPQAIASGLPGTGLGLYICRGIIAAHGGRLWAESPGEARGATFKFTLPAVVTERHGV
jgi:signal transduction histidine kinase